MVDIIQTTIIPISTDIDKDISLLANAMRVLIADTVEQAQSGHPGAAMGMVEIGIALWQQLKHDPQQPHWLNRDRFILSNGHAAVLQYVLLHLSGYDISIYDLQCFRQLHANTPGHPEYRRTVGVESSTGPLGQGLANGVGMALAEKLLAKQFNTPAFTIIDHYVYVCVGDGCLMEGISHEAASLAGTLELSKLIVFYDSNNISIDGETVDWFTEDVAQRFMAYHWQVIGPLDGHDVTVITQAITQAKQCLNQPTLIICRTTIGKGCPNKHNSHTIHGSPLGTVELAALRLALNWQYPAFIMPTEVYRLFQQLCHKQDYQQWQETFSAYQLANPQLAAELLRREQHHLPDSWSDIISAGTSLAVQNTKSMATRQASQQAIAYYAQYLPELFGGSADLTPSNLTQWSTAQTLSHSNAFCGNYLSFGVREFGMSAIANGMFLHGGWRVFCGTFLMFSEYARNAIRMAALMQIAPIFVYTHDSIGVGEDGPTHQPVEQLSSLRLIPNLSVWRPADNVETMRAWGIALSQHFTPTALILSRQTTTHLPRSAQQLENIAKGAYVLYESEYKSDYLILASGTEVALALAVAHELANTSQLYSRVVSMPSMDVFDTQESAYRQAILAPGTRGSIVIEAGVAALWYKYVGRQALMISIEEFGESAQATHLFEHFGFTVQQIIAKILA